MNLKHLQIKSSFYLDNNPWNRGRSWIRGLLLRDEIHHLEQQQLRQLFKSRVQARHKLLSLTERHMARLCMLDRHSLNNRPPTAHFSSQAHSFGYSVDSRGKQGHRSNVRHAHIPGRAHASSARISSLFHLRGCRVGFVGQSAFPRHQLKQFKFIV